MTIYDHLLLIGFAVLYPAYDALFSTPRARKKLADKLPGIRIREYKLSIVFIWFFSIILLILWFAHRRDVTDLGLDTSRAWTLSLAFILLVMGLLYIHYLYRSIQNSEEQVKSLQTKLAGSDISIFLPRTKKDFSWFGLAHAYQGWKGVLQSGAIGLVMALVYVLTGTLWIPIVLHTVIDMYSGMPGWLAFDED